MNGPKAYTTCIEPIPCDPCYRRCPFKAVIKPSLTTPPKIDYSKCTGCGVCVEVCPGLAMFVADLSGEKAKITLPYEFLPLPKKGDEVSLLNDLGQVIGDGLVLKVKSGLEKTTVITVAVPRELAFKVRNIRVKQGEQENSV